MSAIASYSIMHAKGLKKILKQRGVAKDIIAGCAERIDLVELCIETHPDDSDTGDDEDDCSANNGDRGGGGGDVDKGDVNNNSNNGASDQANITTSSDSSTAPLSSSAASASLSSSSTPTTTNDFASLSMKELKKLLKKRGVTPGSACIDKADLVALATKTMSQAARKRVAKPKYNPSAGYVTDRFKGLYFKMHPIEDRDERERATMLIADTDASAPLYFWQLYSLLGERRIVGVIEAFYARVWASDQPAWFRESFSNITTLQSAVNAQAAFWIDAFGGGRAYHGGDYRLNFHHQQVKHVMSRAGAVHWLDVMNLTLTHDADLTKDKRIGPAIGIFLRLMMNKYADEFNFDADALHYGPGSATNGGGD